MWRNALLELVHRVTTERRFGLETKLISEVERVRYLLGISPPAERERIESEYFEDDIAFQQMLSAEDDLIDAYGSSELAAEERWRFERSFASSVRGRERVRFARAFAAVGAPARSVEAKVSGAWLNRFKIFRFPTLLLTATTAAVIVFVAVFVWLVNDRRRTSHDVRDLRTEATELRNQPQELQRGNESVRTHDVAVQAPDRRVPVHQSRHSKSGPTDTQLAQQLPEVKNSSEQIAVTGEGGLLVDRKDATLGNTFVNKRITQLPLEARDVLGLLTLQPAITRPGYVAGERTGQSNITLDGIDVPLNSYSLTPANNRETTIFIPNSLSWLRFQLTLDTAAIHEDYRVSITTTDHRTVTSVDWTEPFTPNQTIIDTPAISTADLPPGDYMLVLMGKEPDGSFVKVAEYALKVIKFD